MSNILDAIVVGAGHAGLGASYYLKQNNLRHIVYERGKIGESWRSQRWDSFAVDWLSLWTGDATVIFESDLVSSGEWNFGAAEAHKISQPVMSLVGIDSPDVFKSVADVIAKWIPQAENYVVPDSSHTIMQMNPGHAAKLITDFVERHPIA